MKVLPLISGLAILAALTATGAPSTKPAQQPTNSSPPVLTSALGRAVSMGAHHRVWEQEIPVKTNRNHVVTRNVRVTELAGGLNKRSSNSWVEAKPDITIQPNGTAAATNAAHQVLFAADVSSAEPIRLVTSDNKTLRSRVLGLAFYDFKKQQSVLIAETKNSVGAVVPGNALIYQNAFEGVKADIRYTNTREGLEQDIILRERLPLPEDYGFDPKTTWLEAWTEFIDPPQPQIRQEIRKGWKKSTVDRLINFGAMKIADGAAFGLGGVPDKTKSVPVQKHWVHTAATNGLPARSFLIEEVSFRLCAPKMRNLPARQHAALAPKAGSKVGIVSNTRLLPQRNVAAINPKEKIRVASIAPDQAGFVLDYLILSSQTDFTFEGGTTYYVTGNIDLDGATTIEGGAVIKYAPDAAINILGTLDCRTESYLPAILTASSDKSVGEYISGVPTTLNPTDRFAEVALSLANGGDLRNLHIRYAQTAVRSSMDYTAFNLQLVHCDKGFDSEYTSCSIKNALLYDVEVGFWGRCFQVSGEHLTFDIGSLAHDWYVDTSDCGDARNSSITLKNSLLTDVSNDDTVRLYAGEDVVFTSRNGIYETVAGGAHYLVDGSPYRDVGTTDISADLAAAIKKKTTYPPVLHTDSTITANTTFSPQAQRDTDTPDLGYHYDPLDHIVAGLTVSGATLTVTSGTAVGFYSSGFGLKCGAVLDSTGKAKDPNRFVWFDVVQEQFYNSSPQMQAGGMLSMADTTCGQVQVRTRFTEFSTLLAGALGSEFAGTISFRDSSFHGGPCYITTCSDLTGNFNHNLSVLMINCLFDRARLGCSTYVADLSVEAYNNLFYKNSAYAEVPSEYTVCSVTLKDNLFYKTDIHLHPDVTIESNNGFVDCPNAMSGSGDVQLTGFDFVNGPLGPYYQPANNLLQNGGSRTAAAAGLYHYTVLADQTKEATTTVDIGLHYVACDEDGNPLDTDLDGTPDYLEDSNGNGTVDGGEGNWDSTVVITMQPQNQRVPIWGSAIFSVQATGASTPLTYQWRFNGVNIQGATGSSYAVPFVEFFNLGSYSVIVSDNVSSRKSSTATLKVTCAESPQGMLAWWKGEQNANDSAEGYHGTWMGTAAYGNGVAGQAFQFNGGSKWISLGSSFGNFGTSDFTIEFWIKTAATTMQSILTKRQQCDASSFLDIHTANGGIGFEIYDVENSVHHTENIVSSPINNNSWHHVALVRRGAESFIYIDGNRDANGSASEIISISNGADFLIGRSPCYGYNGIEYFNGLLDEITIYTTALSEDQIMAIYQAGTFNAGKCCVDPQITQQPANVLVNSGQTATFVVTATGSDLLYQWYRGNSALAGATARTLTVANVQNVNQGAYSVTVKNPCGVITSAGALLAIRIPPQITTQPHSQTVKQGTRATFSVVATGTAPFTYQWRYNAANIANATDSSFTLPKAQLTDAGSYTVIVANAAGSVSSEPAVLTVTPAPVIVTQPQSQTVNLGSSAQFTVQATGVGELFYQWRINDVDIPDATDSSYPIVSVAISDLGNYSVVVSDSNDWIESDKATLRATCAPGGAGMIAWWKGDGNANDAVSGYNGNWDGDEDYDTGLSGQGFLFNGDPNWISFGNSIGNFGTSDFTIEFWLNTSETEKQAVMGKRLVCDAGSFFDVLTSDGGITFELYELQNGINRYLNLASSPINDGNWHHVALVRDGSSASIYIDGTLDASDSISGSPIYISNTADFIMGKSACTEGDGTGYFNGILDEISIYTAILSEESIQSIFVAGLDHHGKCCAPPAITQQPAGATINAGQSAVFSVRAIGTPLKYQWYRNNFTVAGATGSSLTFANAQVPDAGSYKVMVYNDCGYTISINAGLTVRVPPQITTQPQNQTVKQGTPASFSVVATGTAPLTYQWRRNGNNISAATASSHILTAAQLTDSGSYSVFVANVAGSILSQSAILTVTPAPVIITQPQSQTVDLGSGAQFTVQATGVGTLHYQWRFNGQDISGATGSSYSIASVAVSDLGRYSVVVTDSNDWIESNKAALRTMCARGAAGMIAWWKGEGNASDAVGGYSGSWQGSESYNTGAVGQGFKFNGGANWISFGNSVGNFGTGDFTIEFWINTVGTAKQAIIGKRLFCGAGSFFDLRTSQGGIGIELYDNHTGVNRSINLVSRPINDGNWHHVALVREGTSAFLYIDGVRDTTGSISAPTLDISNTAGFTVGKSACTGGDGTGYFNGMLDEISIYTTALAAEAIEDIYAAGVDHHGKCCAPPAITQQPANITVNAGEMAVFTVGAIGTPLQYQWSFGGSVLAAPTTSSLTIANAQPADAGLYKATVFNACGSVSSSSASLTVNVQQPVITTQPVSQTVNYGQTVTFSVVATGQNLTYQWRKGTANIPNATSSSLTFAPTVADAGVYDVVVANGVQVISSPATLVVNRASLTVTAANKSRSTGASNPVLDGAVTGIQNSDNITAVYNTPATIWSPAGTYPIIPQLIDPNNRLNNYNIVIVNGTLTLSDSAPIIMSAPVSQTVNRGSPVSLRTIAVGAPTLTYQWKKGTAIVNNAPNISGATTPSLTILSFGPSDAGSYTVVVANGSGNATSSAAVLSEGNFVNDCNLYPIGLPQWITQYPNIPKDVSGDATSGSFFWLAWNSNKQDAGSLLDSLTGNGNSKTAYKNPRDETDTIISIGDWISTSTGGSGSQKIKEQLDRLKTLDYIILPIWSKTDQGSGSGAAYQFYNYAEVKLNSYDLDNDKKVNVTFKKLHQCEPPSIGFSTAWASYTENDPPKLIDPSANLSDFTMGTLTLSFIANGQSDDKLDIRNEGIAPGQISTSGSNLRYTISDGTIITIGTFSGGNGTSPLVFQFNEKCTITAARQTLRNVTYSNISPDTPSPLARTVRATLENQGASGSATININVLPVNDPPRLTVVAPLSGAVRDGPFNIPFEQLRNNSDLQDVDSSPVVFRVQAVSTGTLTKNGISVSPGVTLFQPGEMLVWTPALNQVGPGINAFTVVGWDGSLASTPAIQVKVNVEPPANQAPHLTRVDTLNGAIEDTAFSISYETLAAASDLSDPDSPPNPYFRIESLSANTTLTKNGFPVDPGGALPNNLLAPGETLVWTAAQDANGSGVNALNAFTVQGWDGYWASALPSVQVKINVSEVNDPPVAKDFAASTAEDSPYTVSSGALIANVQDSPGPANESGQTLVVTAVSSTADTHGSVTLTGGTITYTPSLNFNGTASFSYTITDNGTTSGASDPRSATAIFNLTVTPVNDAPVAIDDDVSTDENRPLTFPAATLASNDSPGPADESGQSLTVTAVGLLTSPATLGTVSLNGGMITYTPPLNFSGGDVFKYQVTDNGATSGSADPKSAWGLVTVTIRPVPLTVDAGPDQTVMLPATASFAGVAFGGKAPMNPIFWEMVSGPAPVTFTPGNALNTVAAFTAPGLYVLKLNVTDSLGAQASDTVVVTVNQNQRPKVNAGPNRDISTGTTSLQLVGSASDDGLPNPPGHLTFEWTEINKPGGRTAVTFSPSDQLTTTATLPNEAGIYSFRLTAWDGATPGAAYVEHSDVVITVRDPRSRTFTRNADFEEGSLLNVNYDDVADQLQLNSIVTPYPFVNIACSQRGTVARIDVKNGQILGEYATAPDGHNKNPSRTTVDKLGNVWVANRDERGYFRNSSSLNAPGLAGDFYGYDGTGGSVTRVGLVIGGTRGNKVNTQPSTGIYFQNKDGTFFVPDPNGAYLRPPFLYNTCIDRDQDGLIKTSRGRTRTGTPDVLPWPHKAGKIVVNSSVATFGDDHMEVDPQTGRNSGNYVLAQRLGVWFTATTADSLAPYRFLVYSDRDELKSEALRTAMGHAGSGNPQPAWDRKTSGNFNPTLQNLLQYDVVILCDIPVDNAVLIEYVRRGGNVYLAAGAGTSDGEANAEAARWNIFLNAFGLGLQGAPYSSVQTSSQRPTSSMAIAKAEISTAGSGYAVDDYVSPEGGGNDAVFRVTAVNGAGGITALEIVDPGSGFDQDTIYSLDGGSGTGGEINVVALRYLIQWPWFHPIFSGPFKLDTSYYRVDEVYFGTANIVIKTAQAISAQKLISFGPDHKGLMACYTSPGVPDDAEDEAIINFVRVPGTQVRTIAIDPSNDVWVGGDHNRVYQKIRGDTGAPVNGWQFPPASYTGTPAAQDSSDIFKAYGAYGGLIDRNGVLWSMQKMSSYFAAGDPYGRVQPFGMLRLNTLSAPTSWTADANGDTTDQTVWRSFEVQTGGAAERVYGIGIDPQTQHIWVSALNGDSIFALDGSPNANVIGKYSHGGSSGRGLAVDGQGNVWVAHSPRSSAESAATIGHLRTDGTYVGNVPLPCGNEPTGVAVDSDGRIWVSDNAAGKAMRINPKKGAIGGNGFKIGAVDLIVDLGSDAGPYNYSDMTGFVSIGATAPSGMWTVVHDGGVNNVSWGKITWNGTEIPAKNAIIQVAVRADNDSSALATRTFTPVLNGQALTGVSGRYIEIQTTLVQGAENGTPVKPILTDLTVTPAGADVVISSTGSDLVKGDSFSVMKNSVGNSLSVLDNDIAPAGRTLTIARVSSAHSGGVLIAADAKHLLYTPDRDFYGHDRFTYTVTDGDSLFNGLVDVQVSQIDPVIAPPIAVDDSDIFVSGNPTHGARLGTVIDVMANDQSFQPGQTPGQNVPDEISIVAVRNGNHGTAELYGVTSGGECPCRVKYTPSPGYSGQDTFTYTIENTHGKTATATVTVDVKPVLPITCDSTLTGTLSTTDAQLKTWRVVYRGVYDEFYDGPVDPEHTSYVQLYEFTATAGQGITVTMDGSFGTQIYILDPKGRWHDYAQHGSGETQTTLTTSFQEAGTYTIIASSDTGQMPPGPLSTGSFTLKVDECNSGPGYLTVTFHEHELNYPYQLNFKTTTGYMINDTLILHNSGGSPLTIADVDFDGYPNHGGTLNPDFQILTTIPTGGLILNPGQSESLNFSFIPPDQGYYSATLGFYDDLDPNTSSFFNVGMSAEVNSGALITMTSPRDEQSFLAGGAVPFTADVVAGTGNTIVQVEFIVTLPNGDPSGAPPLVVTAPPYSISWNNATLGTYKALAKVTISDGTTTTEVPTSEITFHVGKAGVTFYAPVSGSSFAPPANVTLKASVQLQTGVVLKDVVFTDQRTSTSYAQDGAGSGSYNLAFSGLEADDYAFTVTATMYSQDDPDPNNPVTWTVSDGPVQFHVGDGVINNYPPIARPDEAVMVANINPADMKSWPIDVLKNDSDVDGDTLTIESVTDGNGLGRVEIKNNKLFYKPGVLGFGTDSFSYTVSDGHGGTAKGFVSVMVVSGTPPVVEIKSPSGGPPITGQAIDFTVVADAVDDEGITKTIRSVDFYAGGAWLGRATTDGGDGKYHFNWTRVPQGDYQLDAIATDSFGYPGYADPVFITVDRGNPNNQLPIAEISDTDFNPVLNRNCPGLNCPPDVLAQTNPPTITQGKFTLHGIANDNDSSDTVSYQVSLYRPDQSFVATLIDSTSRVPNSTTPPYTAGVLGTLDFSSIENGLYDLELVVFDGYDVSVCRRRFILASQLKTGRLTFSQEDLTIPTAGVPLTIVRTYDSFNGNSADLGYGWTLAMNDLNLEIDEQRTDTSDFFTDEVFSMRVGGGRDVTLTLPDGHRTTFYYSMVRGGCGGFCWDGIWTCDDPGVTAKLTTLNPAALSDTGDNTLFTLLPPLQPYWSSDSIGTPMENHDFPGFKLTLEDGTQYRIDREDLGAHDVETEPGEFIFFHAYGKPHVTSISQPNGTRIQISPTQIDSIDQNNHVISSVVFKRDREGRIFEIYDPLSLSQPGGLPAVKYAYDGKGNLFQVAKLSDRNINNPKWIIDTFHYDHPTPGFEHYLTSLENSIGVKPVINEYGTDGKLSAVTDARGIRTEFIRNQTPVTSGAVGREVIHEIHGADIIETIHEYDSHGNVVLSVDPVGKKTRRYYDNPDHNTTLTSQIDAYGTDPDVSSTTTYAAIYGDHNKITKMTVTEKPSDLGQTITRITEFNEMGQPTIITDPKGYITKNIYDPSLPGSPSKGHLLKVRHYASRAELDADVSDTLGTLISENYYNTSESPADYLGWTMDALNNKTVYTYYTGENGGRFGDVKTIEQKNAADQTLSVTSYTYDINGNRLTETKIRTKGGDPSTSESVTTTFQYDSLNRLTNTLDALNESTGTFYNKAGQVEYTIDSHGNRTSNTYNSQGETVQVEYPNLTIACTATEFVGAQKRTTSESPHLPHTPALATRTTYDKAGRTVRVDNLENVTIELDPEASTAGATMNANIVNAGTVVAYTQTEYDAAGRVWHVTDAKGNTTTYNYDGNGRRHDVIQTARGEDHKTVSEYDENGNQTSIHLETRTAGTGPWTSHPATTYQYDTFNRRYRTTFPLVAGEASQHTQETIFDVLGRRIEEFDQAGISTGYEYDGLGRLITVTNIYHVPTALNAELANQTITRYQYDEMGNLTNQIDANQTIVSPASNQKTTKFEYDKLGRRTKRILPDQSGGSDLIETFAYAAPDTTTHKSVNRVTHTDFNGKTTVIDYDEMGRISNKAPDSSLPPLAKVPVHFTYTSTGRRFTMADANGLTTYHYDNRDRLWEKITPNGTLTYNYDNNGNVTRIKSSHTDGLDTSYSWDEMNRLWKVNPTTAQETVYSYDDFGNLHDYVYPNGVTSTYAYDDLHRLTQLSVTKDSATIARFSYSLGKNGNRTEARETNTIGSITIGRIVNYGYDALYRLTSETIAASAGNTAPNLPLGSIVYDSTPGYNDTGNAGYDRVGNRRTRNVSLTPSVPGLAPTSQSYDANDRLATDTYDKNGNTAVGSVPNGGIVPNSSSPDVYDFENHLIQRSDGTTLIQIVYDGDGNRVKKIVGSAVTVYLVDDHNPSGYAQVVEELTAVGAATPSLSKLYTYGHDLISQKPVSGTESYYGYDGHGNVRFLTDSTGVATDGYTYDAFGTVVYEKSASILATPNSYRYCGEQYDPDLGFYYLRARYMNADSGRFWTMDTLEGLIVDPVSLHKYLYCFANPVNRTDPLGLSPNMTELQVVMAKATYLMARFAGPAAAGLKWAQRNMNALRRTWDMAVNVASRGGDVLASEMQVMRAAANGTWEYLGKVTFDLLVKLPGNNFNTLIENKGINWRLWGSPGWQNFITQLENQASKFANATHAANGLPIGQRVISISSQIPKGMEQAGEELTALLSKYYDVILWGDKEMEQFLNK